VACSQTGRVEKIKPDLPQGGIIGPQKPRKKNPKEVRDQQPAPLPCSLAMREQTLIISERKRETISILVIRFSKKICHEKALQKSENEWRLVKT